MELRRIYSIIYLIIFTSPVFLLSQNSDNIILNGSFEEEQINKDHQNYKEGEKIHGWRVTQESIDLNGVYFVAQDGTQSVDLNGFNSGAIEQRFFTKPGKKYLVSFYMAGNTAGAPQIKELKVSAAEQSQVFQFDITGKTSSNLGWEYKEFIFKAEQRASILKFESYQGPESTAYGPLIDNVVVKRHKGGGFSFSDSKSESFFKINYGAFAGASFYFKDNNTLDLIAYDANRYNLEVADQGVGIHIGGFAELFIGPVFIRPELRLNTNKIKYNVISGASVTGANERYQHFEMPLCLGFEMDGYRFLIAPTGYLYLFKTGNLSDQGDFSSNIKRWTYGYELGFGYAFSFASIDLRYCGNLSRYGDGLIDDNNKHYYTTDQADRLMVSLSINLD